MKNMFSLRFFILVWVLMALFACARQGAPTGGPEDVTPPKVDSSLSTPNFSTRFNQKKIVLTFDEWIVLADVGTQVVISPPLLTKKVPDVTLKGKTITVLIPEQETLRPNTTYTINFGTSIKDYHKGNPAKDLRFVFSTGDFLDSLTVKGTIVDALSGEPIENISFFLYDKFEDSITIKEKPFYFAKTDKAGQFLIENVKKGTFKCVAVEDLDQNLRWTGALERVGFPDSLFVVSDTGQNSIQLKIFNDFGSLRILEKSTNRYGMVKLVYNSAPDTVQFTTDVPNLQYKPERLNDTLFIWYKLPEARAWNLIHGKDSIAIKALSNVDFQAKHRLYFLGDSRAPSGKPTRAKADAPPPPGSPKATVVNQNPIKPAILPFTSPIIAFDTALWQLRVDSNLVHQYTLEIDSLNTRQIRLSTAWQQGKSYNLTLLPGAVTDFYDTPNLDTLRRVLNVSSDKLMGGLNLSISKLKPGKYYILQVLNGNGQVEVENKFEAKGADKRLVFTNLPATQYTLRLIEDQQINGRWDSGSYFKHRQAEPVTIKKLEPLRANWEVEATLEAGVPDKAKAKPKK
jgi:hypothetical protein